MAGKLREYSATFVEVNGRQVPPAGSLILPVKEVAISAEYIDMELEFAIEPEGVHILYNYDEKSHWNIIKLVASGYLYAWIKVDKPVASSDPLYPAQSGLYPRWRQLDVNCHTPFILNTAACRINPTLADDVGTVSPTSDYPIAMDDADTVEGRIYRIVLKNPSLTETVMGKRTLIN